MIERPEQSAAAAERLIQMALTEDIGSGDVTTVALVPEAAKAAAALVARDEGILCGVHIASAVFRQLDPLATVKICVTEGAHVSRGEMILQVRGHARALLSAERVALNFVQRLSGIATRTAAYCDRVSDLPVVILDTRKTAPGWRLLDKYAVCCGGGENHRMGLYDRIMIKDNHLAFWLSGQERTIAGAIQAARARFPEIPVQVEIDHESQLDEVLTAAPDWVLLDNMTPDQVRACVERCGGQIKTEVSGGITLDTVRAYAEAGPTALSIGALTHSVEAFDCALDWDETVR